MEKGVTIKERHNCLSVSVAGDQSYVKIFDADDQLLRQIQGSGATDVQHLAAPGKYKVESDGTILSARSIHLEVPSDAELLGLG
jgi:hypothetical protein